MAITKFACSCGNCNPVLAKEYDGALGYEAIICDVCGRYYDATGEHCADDFSLRCIGRNSNEPRVIDVSTLKHTFDDGGTM